ncbi:MAG: branched-chain amino acid ABC transporter permease [Desulfarculaceae bacterium]|nr:branched-chain amino acid ABC transporter permease [Desulfarculaceae bacterium]
MSSKATYAVYLGIIAGLAVMGLVGDRFVIYMGMRVMLLAIFALGYNILLGRTGLLSFGHGALYACGSYGMALVNLHLTQDPILGILAGVAVAGIFSLIVGFFCVRNTEIYFAMLTLAFGMMIFSLIWNLREITGGDDGLVGISRGSVFGLPIVKDNQYFFFVLFFFGITLWLVHRIRSSAFGLVLAGIRENHQRTSFAGIPVKQYRLAAFVISGMFAGLSGSLGAMLQYNTDPFSAHWSHSAEPILVSLIGGLQTFSGPLAGSVIFVVLREVIERFTQNWMLWFGIILLAIIMGLRGGVMGGLEKRLRERAAARKGVR